MRYINGLEMEAPFVDDHLGKGKWQKDVQTEVHRIRNICEQNQKHIDLDMIQIADGSFISPIQASEREKGFTNSKIHPGRSFSRVNDNRYQSRAALQNQYQHHLIRFPFIPSFAFPPGDAIYNF